jgi:hypothetical protein
MPLYGASIDMAQITLGDININVIYKDIKKMWVYVYSPHGSVRISAPMWLDLDTIRAVAVSRLGWIRKQQAVLSGQARKRTRGSVDRQSCYYLGKRYRLRVRELEAAPKVVLKRGTIEVQIRPGASARKKREVLSEWYRQRLKEIIPPIIGKWDRLLNVNVRGFGIRKMKTQWGSCNPKAGSIWLSLQLAKKPLSCIEYVTVHEMVHLIERGHGDRFTAQLDKFLPTWRSSKEELNRRAPGHRR